MKATELMIGDWVSYKGKSREVFAVSYSHIELTNEDNEIEIIGYRGRNLEPIPLTAEILEKNGFEKGRMVEYSYWKSQAYVDIYLQYNGEGEVRAIDILNHPKSYRDNELQNGLYVHEFQHALRLCGLTELANNFKI